MANDLHPPIAPAKLVGRVSGTLDTRGQVVLRYEERLASDPEARWEGRSAVTLSRASIGDAISILQQLERAAPAPEPAAPSATAAPPLSADDRALLKRLGLPGTR